MTELPREENSFGQRFVAEALRLGVPLSAWQIERLSRASKGQIMLVAEKRLPLLNPELLRLLGRRGPEALARELLRKGQPEPGIVALAGDVVDTAITIDIFVNLLSGVDA